MDGEQNQGQDGPLERLGQALGLIFAALTLIVLFVGGIYAIGDAVLSETPVSKNPGFIDSVLASRAVVAAIRIAIIVLAAYLVISAVWLIANRRFLVRVGPVQVSEQVSDIDAENRRLSESLENARETIDNLKQDLAESNQLLDQLTQDPEDTR